MRNREKFMYVLIDTEEKLHYGFSYNELQAREKANELNYEYGLNIEVFEFVPEDEF